MGTGSRRGNEVSTIRRRGGCLSLKARQVNRGLHSVERWAVSAAAVSSTSAEAAQSEPRGKTSRKQRSHSDLGSGGTSTFSLGMPVSL